MKSKNRSDESTNIFGFFLLVACGLFSCFAWNWWYAKTSFDGLITRIHWDYAWDIEELRAVNHRCEYSGCQPEHSYNHSTDTDCTTSRSGNSTTMRCDTDYLYTINEWVVVATEHATGEGNRERPHYPELTLVREFGSVDCPDSLYLYSPDSEALGCQRAGQQHPHHLYEIETRSLNENFTDTCETGFGRWTELSIEDLVSGDYFSNRNRIDCASVEFN